MNLPQNKEKLISVLIGSVALGIVCDCLVVGVAKILWFPIYGPVYFGISLAIYNSVLRVRGKELALIACLSFLSGTAICHLISNGRVSVRVYPMKMVSDNPITLQSPSFSQTLLITSDKVRSAIGDHPDDVPVAIQVIKDYGCIQSFKVTTVANVDVMFDNKADWVWREQRITSTPAGGFDGQDEENHRLLWCRIKWF